MTYRKNVLRPGMTAIVAVLALSSTQSFAQDATTTSDAPPTPVTAPEPAQAPTPAPEPVISEIAPPAAEPVAEAAPRAQPTAQAAPVRRAAAPARRVAPRPAVAAASAPAAPAAASLSEPAPIAAAPAPAVPAPIPVQLDTAPAAEASTGDDILPIAGVAGVGILALAGGAVALSRRRRRGDEVGYEPETIETDHVATVEPEPAAIMPVAARAAAERTALPASADLSHHGRHTQAAYRGPTPDNPSLSLKRRLKRAAFFDGRERMAGESAAAALAQPAPMAAAAGALTTKVEPPVGQPVAPAFAPRRTVRPASKPLFSFHQPAFQN